MRWRSDVPAHTQCQGPWRDAVAHGGQFDSREHGKKSPLRAL